EISKHTAANTLRVCVFHGLDRTSDSDELARFDVVLSTYAIVESSFRKERYGFKRKGVMVKEPSPIHKVDWYRVILDEAHSIKDRTSSTARAVFALRAEKKWSLSGTPLQNRVGELIINFGHEHEAGALGFRKLARLLDRVMLRRTKVQKAADLGLPPKVVVVRRDYFNEEEDDLYSSLYGDAKRKFDTYVAEETVLNNYANIFELLMKMRQAANHPDLVTKKGLVASEAEYGSMIYGVNPAFPGTKRLHYLSRAKSLVCGICNEPAEDAIISKCKHTFCREDAREYIESAVEENPRCPVCFRPLTIDLSQEEVLPQETGSNSAVKKSIVNYLDMSAWRSSTKIEALVEELTNLKKKDTTVKSIVFSQFVNFLGEYGINMQASFMTNVHIDVFLISLKAGGIALNLTEASNVFLMDPWWNPAVEEQAMDRIHRLGQHRPIKITRIIIENSIESRIIQLQLKKKAMFDSTVGKDMSALARLTQEDFEFLFVN
ncbi:DNA repair protein rad16, partial [Gonapodya sp. JEL0774]